MKTKISVILILVALLFSNKSYSHCEIPCGIYGDSLRIAMIAEDITTIEKSMNEIVALSQDKSVNYNQLVRWVNNKEEHANKIQAIVSDYFLHQRVKIQDPSNGEAYAKYIQQLTLLHKLAVYAMKAKQTTDLENVKLLRQTLDEFDHLYFHKHE
ncbi:MAG: superoxide dismutase [Ni] [Prolixibacteraceae bacterium]